MMALTLLGSREGVKPCSLQNCLQSSEIVGNYGGLRSAGVREVLVGSVRRVSADIQAARLLFPPVATGACAAQGGGACGQSDWRPDLVDPGRDRERWAWL